MNCKQAKQNIALFAGNDLDPMSTRDLKRHLKECPGCVEQWERMRTSVEALQTHCPSSGPIEDSVWPEIVVRLPKQRTVRQRPNRFNGWAPSLAVVAACGLMVMLARWNAPTGGRPGASTEVPASNFNAVFSPDTPAFDPVFTRSPAPVGDEMRPYQDLLHNAYREVNAASTSKGYGRGGSTKRPLSNRN